MHNACICPISPDLSSLGQFEASSTCGAQGPEQFPGVSLPGPGNPSSPDTLVCNASDPETSHPASLLTDGDNRTFWLSGGGVEQVSLTLDLGGFHVLQELRAWFVSPLPLSAVLEVSQDFGDTYHPLRYYSDDCASDFGLPDAAVSSPGGGAGSGGGDVGVDELVCTSQFSSTREDGLVCSAGRLGEGEEASYGLHRCGLLTRWQWSAKAL